MERYNVYEPKEEPRMSYVMEIGKGLGVGLPLTTTNNSLLVGMTTEPIFITEANITSRVIGGEDTLKIQNQITYLQFKKQKILSSHRRLDKASFKNPRWEFNSSKSTEIKIVTHNHTQQLRNGAISKILYRNESQHFILNEISTRIIPLAWLVFITRQDIE